MKGIAIVLVGLAVMACESQTEEKPLLLRLLPPASTGIDFENRLTYTESFNCYTYRNFYNGAGVAVGDINNDGLMDVYLAGNQADNKLYLNKGGLTFEDIADRAGVACPKVWSTGVSMADVNGDGWTDIFVCKSGPPFGGTRHNELFINNGDLTFREESEKWGVADEGLSLHAVFFDYDHDDDLDLYLLNNSNRQVGIYDLREGQRELRDPFGGNKLYRNDGNRFVDVSAQAGIYSSSIGFGLGVVAADINRDGWQDLFVSNDFFERDYLYLNQKNGTFRECLNEFIDETSLGSMGADVADLNNDGFAEIYVTEMLPGSFERIRTKASFEDWNKFSENVRSGYGRQFSRNVLQLNNGWVPGDKSGVAFSEIGRFAGVHATDWSWGALIFDINLDGLKDIYVANGIPKDLLDQDYIHYTSPPMLASAELRRDSSLMTRLIDAIPSSPQRDALFLNRGDSTFEDVSMEVGMTADYSNGAAYADFDNDGDLDLVVNRINETAAVYENTARETDEKLHFLQIKLVGKGLNTSGIGAQIVAFCGQEKFYVEQSPVRGYLSTVDPRIHLGLGSHQRVDSLVVNWNDGTRSVTYDVSVDQLLVIKQSQSDFSIATAPATDVLLVPDSAGFAVSRRTTAEFNDFDRDRLIFDMMSNEGQRMQTGDVNADGLPDLFIGGAAGQPGEVWIQKADLQWEKSLQNGLINDAGYEDRGAAFLDADGDGDQDLFVASGGYQFGLGSNLLEDRLYLNDGRGSFQRKRDWLSSPMVFEPTSAVVAIDVNRDGLPDLVTASRFIPFAYGRPTDAHLFLNRGGYFEEVTDRVAPGFRRLGLLTDANKIDFDQDGDDDIVFSGEWMGVKIFENTGGRFVDRSQDLDVDELKGRWMSLHVSDINGDKYPDLILGNEGENVRYPSTSGDPSWLYVGDFDQNGSIEQLLCAQRDDRVWALSLLPDLVKQMPSLRKRFLTFSSYSQASISDLLLPEQVARAEKYMVNESRSMTLINDRGRLFQRIPLPSAAQLTKVYGIEVADFNGDGFPDLVLGGNQYQAKPEMGIQGAGFGLILTGDGSGRFKPLPASRSGVFVRGEIRDFVCVSGKSKGQLLVLRNNDKMKVYRYGER
ncbi:MAG: VCBS repeat-containing protein [Cyclobacteriaceae bacterium]|jgi:hypothetical protein